MFLQDFIFVFNYMNEFLLTSSMLEQSYMFNIFPFFWVVFILLVSFVQRIDLAIIISRPYVGRAFRSLEWDVASILLVQGLDCLAGDMLKCVYMSTSTRLRFYLVKRLDGCTFILILRKAYWRYSPASRGFIRLWSLPFHRLVWIKSHKIRFSGNFHNIKYTENSY